MADDAPEGWQVPQRRAVIAAIAAPLTLLALVAGAGWLYERDFAVRQRPVTAFPAPGVESYVHDGARDPERPELKPQRDAQVDAAKRAVVAGGWPK
jgi:hypothetical protein